MWRASSSAIRCWSGGARAKARGARARAGPPPAAPGPAPPAPDGTAVADWTEGGRERSDAAARERTVADLEGVPPADTDAASSRSNGEAVPGYSEWAGTGTGGRDNADYNLEAFVSAHTTL